eukprot:scaffold5.g845.t1
MNTAWYLHLKFTAWPLVAAIFISWGIAFFEYCLQVPANRLGHYEQGGPFTAPQLKVIQEAISLTTFAIFSVLVLKEKLRWTDYIAFALVFGGVAVSLAKPLASKDVAALPELEAPAPEPAAEAAAAVPPASPALQLAEGGAAARSPAPRQESSGEGRKLLVQLTPLSHAGGGTAAEEHQQRQWRHWRAGSTEEASSEALSSATPPPPAADDGDSLFEQQVVRWGELELAKKRKPKAKAAAQGPVVVSATRDAVYGGAPLTFEQRTENAAVVTLGVLFSTIVLEGVFLAASGFLNETADHFATDVIYPAFSPTVVLFLALSSLYGLWKTKIQGADKPSQ